MNFWVSLIRAAEPLTQSERADLDDNCTHVKGSLWIMEGDVDALTAEVHTIAEGIVGALGGKSESELIQICNDAFDVNMAAELTGFGQDR